MAFWSSEKLAQRIPAGQLITPYNPNRIHTAAYELSVGPERYVSSDPAGVKHELEDNEHFMIPPGQVALLLTEERVLIPNDALALISIKAGIKFRGLVNVSGFHVDPGFEGRLKFCVYNAGSQTVLLSRNQPAFLIWFSDLDRKTQDVYEGVHKNQMDLTPLDVMQLQGEIASPQQLKKDILELQNSLLNVKTILNSVLGVVISLMVGVVLVAFRIIPVSAPPSPTVIIGSPTSATAPSIEKNSTIVEKPASDQKQPKKEKEIKAQKDTKLPEAAKK